MDNATERKERLDKLRRMLAAREGQPGFKENSVAIRDEIARLEERAA